MRKKVTEHKLREIIQALQGGDTLREVANKTGLSISTIHYHKAAWLKVRPELDMATFIKNKWRYKAVEHHLNDLTIAFYLNLLSHINRLIDSAKVHFSNDGFGHDEVEFGLMGILESIEEQIGQWEYSIINKAFRQGTSPNVQPLAVLKDELKNTSENLLSLLEFAENLKRKMTA